MGAADRKRACSASYNSGCHVINRHGRARRICQGRAFLAHQVPCSVHAPDNSGMLADQELVEYIEVDRPSTRWLHVKRTARGERAIGGAGPVRAAEHRERVNS